MGLVEDTKDFTDLSLKLSRNNILRLVRICKMLTIPQKIITVILMNFFIAKQSLRIEPDDLVLFTSCINITCKMAEIARNTENILKYSARVLQVSIEDPEVIRKYLEAVNITELDICKAMDFDFEIPDVHKVLKSICSDNNFDMKMSKCSWIVLNDITTFTPACVYFTQCEIVYSSILIATTLAQIEERKDPKSMKSCGSTIHKEESETLNGNEGESCVLDDVLIDNFRKRFNLELDHMNYILFLARKILELYMNTKKQNSC